MTSSEDPLISLIIAVHGVEKYLSDFLMSLENQDLSEVELIFVDDGSPDNSAEIIAGWLGRNHTSRGRLIRQDNAGAGNARNAGLSVASGEWLSFPDPDDVLVAGYLSQVIEAIQGADESLSMIATPLIMFNEADGTLKDTHPLRGLFNGPSRRVRLTEQPAAIKISGATSFIRHSVVREHGLSFNPALKPNFEDSDLVTRYLATFDDPILRTLPNAHYHYRTREDASSLVSSSWSKPEKYSIVPIRGWLSLVQDISAKRGSVPRFVQNVILYDMSWYFSADARIHTPTKSLSDSVSAGFLDAIRKVLAYIEPATILDYAISYVSNEVRAALFSLSGGDLSELPITLWRIDESRGLAQIKYYASPEDVGDEQFSVHGKPITPVWDKYRAVRYFRGTLLFERIVWLPFHEGMHASIGGSSRHFQIAGDSPASWSLSPVMARRVGFRGVYPQRPTEMSRTRTLGDRVRAHLHARKVQIDRIRQGNSPRFYRAWDRFTRRTASRSTRFEDAWILMDRDTQAQDNAEHLYRWIVRNRPEINAWFVLSKTSADWGRLRAEGFRLVPFGSWTHTLLLLRAKHLISSHIDKYVVQPLHPRRFKGKRWSFTFLQHGVTKDDISRWLNPKPVRRIISVGVSEQSAFANDGSPYMFTEREAVLTGFPRHDELFRLARTSASERPYILIIPTWREYLLGPVIGTGSKRMLAPGFKDSQYARAWGALLNSEELRDAAQKAGKKIVFVSHPNLEAHVDQLDIPAHVSIRTYAETNIQDLIAGGAALITDYSSIAFDSAFIGTPCVYFQFDREVFFAEHPHRPGYFSYESDGFGPVTTEATAAVAATVRAVTAERDELNTYRSRADEFFAFRDEGACQRVFESILAIDNPDIAQPTVRAETSATTRSHS